MADDTYLFSSVDGSLAFPLNPAYRKIEEIANLPQYLYEGSYSSLKNRLFSMS